MADKRDMTDTGVSGQLTDGSGIGTFTAPKIVKDLVLDFLLTAPAALVGVGVMNLDSALVASGVVVTALADAVIRVVYRGLLKWAQTP